MCPDPLVIQTDWFPEAEHGALYEMIGDDYTIDTDKKTVTGSLVVSGQDYGVNLEIRAGGPAIASPSVAAEIYIDDSIHDRLHHDRQPDPALRGGTAAVASWLRSRRTHRSSSGTRRRTPTIETIADLGEPA